MEAKAHLVLVLLPLLVLRRDVSPPSTTAIFPIEELPPQQQR